MVMPAFQEFCGLELLQEGALHLRSVGIAAVGFGGTLDVLRAPGFP